MGGGGAYVLHAEGAGLRSALTLEQAAASKGDFLLSACWLAGGLEPPTKL